MVTNENLIEAKKAKNDEFYTRFVDVQEELCNYVSHFKNKVVLCNCDNPTQSAFWKYFHFNFKALGLKKLISTYYDSNKRVYKTEYMGGNDNDIAVGIKTPLKGDGDFRSLECLDVLNEADIVVTNPPFSLAREFISCLVKRKKKFIILGNLNWITYKNVFPLLKDNKVWIGCRALNKDMYFDVPNEHKKWLVENKKEGSAYKIINDCVYGRLASICWFTNLDHKKRHERKLETTHLYEPSLYQKYDNCDAININKVSEIPMNYDGIMGVPITFMDKYNLEQFEILGIDKDLTNNHKVCMINGKQTYKRILIRKRRIV
jgi:hypothetical protein